MISLEEQLEKAYTRLEISPKNQGSINTYLTLLKLKDQATYEHSIRVGLLGTKVAKHCSLDSKALFYSGTLHDIGKILIRTELLKKTGKFNKKDMAEMKKHPECGYNLLSGIHDFSAEIALRHHKYQKTEYPKKLYKPKAKFSKETVTEIDFYARILSMIDFYDAATTRTNQKFRKKKLNREEVKQFLLKNNSDIKRLIEELYFNKIFKVKD